MTYGFPRGSCHTRATTDMDRVKTQPKPSPTMPMTNRLASLAVLAPILAAVLAGPTAAQRTQDFAVVADATVTSASPTTTDGRSRKLAVGAGQAAIETFLQFDLRSIPRDATVLRAVFSYDADSLSTTTPSLDFLSVTGKWTERDITFQTRPTSGSFLQSDTPDLDKNSVEATTEFLAAIQGWVANPGANLGLRIRTTTGTEKNPSKVNLVSREGATKTSLAATLRLTFAKVRVATASLPPAFTGVGYRTVVEASTLGVNAVEWSVLDSLPDGFSSAVEGQTLVISGRSRFQLRREIRIEVRDPVTGLSHTRTFLFESSRAQGRIRIRNGIETLEGGVFESANPQPVVAMGLSFTNEFEVDCALRQVTFQVMGSIDVVQNLESASLFLDRDNDGTLSAGDVRVAGPQAFASTALPIRVVVDDTALPRLTTRRFLLVIQPRRGCPVGAEFAAEFGNTDVARVVFAGGNTSTGLRFSPFHGPGFVCERRLGFPGDANDDGTVDCLDLQVQARRLGAAATAAVDPNANGLVDADDLQMIRDAALGRPVVTRVEILEVESSSRTRRFARVLGFGFGEEGRLRVAGRDLRSDLRFHRDRILFAELDNLQQGLLEVVVENGARKSTPRRFEFR
jgi:hypothetical protein